MRSAALILIVLTSISLYSQNAKPNFTGTYELDRSASQGSGGRQPAARTLSVEHDEPKLKYTYQGRNRTQEFNLTTDGSDQVRDEPKGESRLSARWDGAVLEIRSYLKGANGEMTTVERWSADGSGVLTIQMRSGIKSSRESGQKASESTLIFRKKS